MTKGGIVQGSQCSCPRSGGQCFQRSLSIEGRVLLNALLISGIAVFDWLGLEFFLSLFLVGYVFFFQVLSQEAMVDLVGKPFSTSKQSGNIGLITVLEAILTGRQTCPK